MRGEGGIHREGEKGIHREGEGNSGRGAFTGKGRGIHREVITFQDILATLRNAQPSHILQVNHPYYQTILDPATLQN